MKASEKELRDALSLKNSEVGCKNYSIKAGAGGGKTTLLSTRICRQIVLGTPIDKFVIITYTNAAAAELRDKIGARLTEFIKAPESSGKQLENAKEALASIELMQISTIHAFLLKILKEYAFETGIALDVKMLEEEEDNERKTGFFNSWYSDHYDEIQKYKWIHTTKEGKEIDVTREIFLNMFMDIANVREVISYDTNDHAALFEEHAKKYVAEWLPKLLVFKTGFLANAPRKKDGNIKINPVPQKIIDIIAEVEGSDNTGIEEALKLSNAIGRIKGIVDGGNQFYGSNGDISQLESFIPVIPEWELEWNFKTLYENYMLRSSKATEIVDYVCRMQSEYQKKNDAETLALSNDDILFRSEKLIAEHPEVLDKLREKYDKIYVDEFQDTTGLQAGIVKMLSEKPGTAPEANDLQNDKLIFVGDPKQSIYRFTGAEKAVYDEMDAMLSKRPSSVAESVALDTNFRSNKTIVDWVNDKFKKLMPGSYSPMDTDWTVSEKEALHGVFKYVPEIGVNDKGNPNKYTTIHDTEKTAELIKKLVDNDKIFIEKPNRNEDGSFGTPSLCKIQYSDIMVVTKNTTKMKEYVEKFAECGIPVIVQGKFSVESDEILKNFILLTQYLAEPKNRKNRMEAIQVITGMDVTKADADEIKKAGECLRELRTFFREHSMDAASIMRYLLSREKMFLPRNKTFNKDDVKKYRIRLNQMVETCLASNDGGFSQLAALMKNYLSKKIKREIPLDSDENSVRLMNVHQSKGLTGQIVIIADRSNKEGCRYNKFKSKGKYYPEVRYKMGENSITIASFGWNYDLLHQAYEEEMAENIRFQYVAATRAAHALIIMPEVYGNCYPHAWFTDSRYEYDSLPDINEWVMRRNGDANAYELSSANALTAHVSLNLSELEKNKANADVSNLTENRKISITPSGLEPKGTTGYAYGEQGFVHENRPASDVFGTVMHRVFELVVIRYDALNKMHLDEREKAIVRIINQAILENSEDMDAKNKPEAFFDFLKEKVCGYFDTVISPIMSDAYEVYPEYEFSFYVDDSERNGFISDFKVYLENARESIMVGDEPIWVNGKADLVVKKNDGSIIIYDYKSDAENGKPLVDFEKSLAGKYEGQLALYRYAIGKAFENTDVKTEIIHLYK